MSPQAHQYLCRLFELFDVVNLGEGDLTAGVNTLAAMALAIAGSQRPDFALCGANGSRTAIGGSFLVSGALSAGLVAEHLIVPLAERQTALSANLRDWREDEQRRLDHAARTGRPLDEEGRSQAVNRESKLNRITRMSECGESDEAARGYRNLLVRPPGSGVRELQSHPMIFSSIGSPVGIRNFMEGAHSGRPLLHVPLAVAADAKRFASSCNRVIDGCHVLAPEPRHCKGELIVTDPCGVLAAVVRGGGADGGWLQRLPWLTDHAAGPAIKLDSQPPSGARLDKVIDRFREALSQTWAERMNMDGKASAMEYDFREHQAAWVNYLATCEPSFPGITAAMRPLAASLAYGLRQIYRASQMAKEATLDLVWVCSFAATLAQRMVDARAQMVNDEHRDRVMRIANTMRRKLEDGAQTVRDLSRRSYRVSIPDCEEALDFLKEGGIAERVANRWSLTRQHCTASPTPLIINV